jgi:hypothetical protein
VAGFPNLFLMYGPNTNLGHSSIVYMLESQASYNAWVDDTLRGTVWNSGGCSSWYLDSQGRNSVMWPTFTFRFRARTKTFDVENYRTRLTWQPSA